MANVMPSVMALDSSLEIENVLVHQNLAMISLKTVTVVHSKNARHAWVHLAVALENGKNGDPVMDHVDLVTEKE